MERGIPVLLAMVSVLFCLLTGSSAAAQTDDVYAGNDLFVEDIGMLFRLLSFDPIDSITSMVVYSYGGGSDGQVLGRFATWCGKVNVHTNGSGEWVVDDDCSSGCERNGISYCRKFWPETIEIREVTLSDTLKPFVTGGCGSTVYGKGHHEYECLGEVSEAVCGDGVKETGEECDDGNTVSGDGCSSQCEIEECDDETPYGECSSEKPKYYDENGDLVDDCVECGCPSGMECQNDGSCKEPFEKVKTIFLPHTSNGNSYDPCNTGNCEWEKTGGSKLCERGRIECYFDGECIGNVQADGGANLRDVNNDGVAGAICMGNSRGGVDAPSDVDKYQTGSWVDCDAHQTICESYRGQVRCGYDWVPLNNYHIKSHDTLAWGWTCCGDDPDEYYICNKNDPSDCACCETEEHEVSGGICRVSRNKKRMSKYSDREVFLVSDNDWREVLSLVPVTTWTGNEDCQRGQGTPEDVCVYPTLIYHDETRDGNGFDADSIIYFMQQYDTERVTIIGQSPKELDNLLTTDPETGAGLNQNDIKRISKNDYFSYWDSFDSVVYVEDDYETALMASAYASLINVPLMIKNYNDGLDLSKKNVICVGNPGWNCNERYTLSQLQQRYVDMTGTDKVILTNSRLDIAKEDVKRTEQGGKIITLFGKTSLSAPYLASSKKEIIITVTATEAEPIDNHLKNRVRELDILPEYLTVMASPLEIQNTISFKMDDGREVDWSIDNTKYGNMDNDLYGFAELKTGRIYGFSISDVSSYIARDLFHDRLGEGEKFLFAGQGVGAADEDAEMLAYVFSNSGYSTDYRTYDDPVTPGDMESKKLMNLASHGSTGGTTISTGEVPEMSNTIILTSSCMLCAFDSLYSDNYGELFCLELLRKGSLGTIVSVDTAGFNWDSTRLNTILSKDLGTVFKRFQNFNHARNKWYIEDLEEGEDTYETLQSDIQMLLGDPTLYVPFEKVILPETDYEISYLPAGSPDTISIDVRIPSVNVKNTESGNTHAFIEGTDSFVQAKFAKFFLKIGPVDLFDNYYVESDDVNPVFFGGIGDVAVQQEVDGTYIYFLIEKRLLSNPLDTVTWNDINIKIISRTCTDGTPYGECSHNRPKYCNGEGRLVEDCQECGCPEGMEYLENGSCSETKGLSCEWTGWHDDDDPSGKGDYERVYCPEDGKPVDVECVTLDGTDHSETGETYTCSTERPGGVCVNSDQPDGYCMDYKVRVLCCPEGCMDSDSGDDPYHEGTITYYDKREEGYALVELKDYCQDGNHLFEYWCSSIGLGAGGRRYCPYGCTGGECI